MTPPLPGGLSEPAPAKINLTLTVIGRRPDGYHELVSLVAFAGLGDRVGFSPGAEPGLDISGPFAATIAGEGDNLVLKAARELRLRVDGLASGRFALTKNLPVASGIGGGSADAAAALRLLARSAGIPPADPRVFAAARATGADVPVCLDPRARLMRGIGDILSEPLGLPGMPAVLVNPAVAVETRAVFAALAAARAGAPAPRPGEAPHDPLAGWCAVRTPEALIRALAAGRNDLEPPAIAIAPQVAEVLARLRAEKTCRLARMSGSGATCFALFDTARAAAAAAEQLRAARPAWWIEATTIG